jgi:glycerol transport system substrate-binding protein
MFNKLKTILTVAVTYSIVISSAYSDAITDLAKGEFSLSTISEKERIKELKWFQGAAKPFKGMSIKVVSEGIPTHVYESKVLTKAFEDVTGI